MADYERSDFARALLPQVGAPITDQNVNFVLAWMQREGTKAKYNPLATTLSYGGGTGFNSVGVKNYPDFATGVAATAQTLLHSGYDDILAGLRGGAGAWNASHGLSRWSGGGYSSLSGVSGKDAAVASGSTSSGGSSLPVDLFGVPTPADAWGFLQSLNPANVGGDIVNGLFRLAVFGTLLAAGGAMIVLGGWRAVTQTQVYRSARDDAQSAAKVAAVAAA